MPVKHVELPLTPYAELLVRPGEGDHAIRQVFHVIARLHHPDRPGGVGKPGSRWAPAKAAYELIKTEPLRRAWAAQQALLSGVCVKCRGEGVAGWPKVKLCAACVGKGRKA